MAELFGIQKANLQKTGNPLDDFDLTLARNLTLMAL